MINFAYVGFVDTFSLVASLRAKMNLFAGEGPLKALILRDVDADGKARAHPLWRPGKWPELTNRIKQIQRVEQVKAFELGRVALELLSPGGWAAWSRGDPGGWLRFHAALVTNPACVMYAGPETYQVLTGSVVWVNQGVPTSQVNFGEFNRIHLVVEFRKRETDAESAVLQGP